MVQKGNQKVYKILTTLSEAEAEAQCDPCENNSQSTNYIPVMNSQKQSPSKERFSKDNFTNMCLRMSSAVKPAKCDENIGRCVGWTVRTNQPKSLRK